MEEEQKYKSIVTEILPNTLRNQNLKAKKQEEESLKKAEQDKVNFPNKDSESKTRKRIIKTLILKRSRAKS